MAGILDGKVALVTGGASGHRAGDRLAMAREGARVAVADRAEADAAATVALINAAGGQAIAIGGDVTAKPMSPRWWPARSRPSGGSIAPSTMPASPARRRPGGPAPA